MRTMALDIGDKRIGMAISDLMGWTAQPLYTIHRKNLEKDMEEIVENIDKYLPTTLVVGLPKNMDGSSGFQADKTIEFVERLKEKLPDNIEVVYQDERLSTKSASQVMTQNRVKKKDKKGLVDTIAAVFILETYLMKKK
ncbi:Holliday junction resolvase RuvX [Filifactor villosus]|uniref:Putative pre-16S rRNA nuclease n=1 Tax=Filifactor villosus TaxID=29374 RepID=A0ABV9QKC1_9FIRM